MLFFHCLASCLKGKTIIHTFSLLIEYQSTLFLFLCSWYSLACLKLNQTTFPFVMEIIQMPSVLAEIVSVCQWNYSSGNGSDLGLVANRIPQLGHQSALAGSKTDSRLFMVLAVLGFSPAVTALLSSLTGLCVTRRRFWGVGMWVWHRKCPISPFIIRPKSKIAT